MSEASYGPAEKPRPGGPGASRHEAAGQPGPGERHRNEAVLGPFTVRDLTLLGGVLITFVGSLLPLLQRNVLLNLWNAQNVFFLAIGFLLPAAAAGLFIWRRLDPHRSLRVGSLSVDQFASVAAVLSCSYYFVFTVTTFTPGAVVGLLGGVALVAATTAARVVPPFAGDFDGRPATPAHIVARDAVQPVHRPAGTDTSARVGAAAGPSAEDRTGTSADDDRSAAWFGAGWAASAAGSGAAAGAGLAGAGAREAGAAVEPGPSAGPVPSGTAAERPLPAGAAPAGPARGGVTPSADDVARPDEPRATAAQAAVGVRGPGAHEPAAVDAREAREPEGAASAEAREPERPAGADAREAREPERAAGADAREAREPERAADVEAHEAAAAGGARAGQRPAAAAEAAPGAAEAAASAGAGAGDRAGAPTQLAPQGAGPETVAMPAGRARGEVERENGRQFLDRLAEEPEATAAGPAPAGARADEPAGGYEQTGAEREAYEPAAPGPTRGAADERGSEPAQPWLEGTPYGEADGEAYGAPESAGPATAVFPSTAGAGAGGGSGSAAGALGGTESIGASRPFDEPAQHYEAFWFAVSQPRTAVDAMTGEPLFILEPGQWILALQDRGNEFVVQNTDGRVGVLRELSGIERG